MARLTSVFAVAVLRETLVAISTTRIVGDPEAERERGGARQPVASKTMVWSVGPAGKDETCPGRNNRDC